MSITEDEDSPGTVAEQAADWIVRQDGDGLGSVEQRAFDAWLAAPGHQTAYNRHRAVWQRYQTAGAASPIGPIALARPRERRAIRYFRQPQTLVASAVAACLALAMLSQIDDWPIRLRADYVTGIGQRRVLTLADGSQALLDGRSAIAFDRSGDRRTLRLFEGSAAVRVVPDPGHPFTVETPSGKVTALGTAFAVRERDGRTELAVIEHSVKVQTEQGNVAIVRAGEGTTFTSGSVDLPTKMDVAAATAWTRGKLIVSNRPLGEVVAEIGRQRRGYWMVRGDAAMIRINGVYDLTRPLAALNTLERTLKLKSFRLSDRIIVLSR